MLLYVFHLGTPPTSSRKTSVERKTDTEAQTTTGNVKTIEGVRIIVEKKTSPTHTPEPTEPTPTPKKQETDTKIRATPLSTEKTPFIVKVEVEQEQKTGGGDGKLQEEDKEKSEGVFAVQKVTEEEEEKKQTAEEPEKITVVKVANDETDWDEEADLESGKTGKNEKPEERFGNAAVATPVKTSESEITVEKITPSPKSPTQSTKSEVVKVERVSSKPNVATKRSFVERIEEDEDLQVAGEAQSPDGEQKIEVTVEKESKVTVEKTTPSAKSPTKSTQDAVVKVERVPSELNVETKRSFAERIEEDEDLKVAGVAQSPDGEQKVEVTVEKESTVTVEKITPSAKSPTKSTQNVVVKVERVPSELNVETKRSFVERIEEDEDLKVAGEAQSPDGEQKVEVTVEKESTVTVGKITPSPKSPTKSTQDAVVKVERVPSELNVETKRSFVERIEEDEDLKVAGEGQSPDGEQKIEVTVEKESTEASSAKESSSGQQSIVEVKRVSPATDGTDEEVTELKVIAKPTVKPTTTKELPISQGNVEKVSISVEKITPSQHPTSGKSQTFMVKGMKVEKVTTEDEDLDASQNAANYKRSDDASEKTSGSDEEALELELEGGQNKLKTEKDKVDEQKLAQEFDKALEAERNGKENLKTGQSVEPAEGPKTPKPPQVTTGKTKPTTEAKGDGIDKQLEKLNVEAAPEKVEVRKVMSAEELELAELARETMNDEDKEEVKPTKNSITATPQDMVTKVEKVSKVTVQVTKERTENLLSEEETAKEEMKLKVELANELEQEKVEVSIRD